MRVSSSIHVAANGFILFFILKCINILAKNKVQSNGVCSANVLQFENTIFSPKRPLKEVMLTWLVWILFNHFSPKSWKHIFLMLFLALQRKHHQFPYATAGSLLFFFSPFLKITQWIYYIYSCTMITTIQFYRIFIPHPQPIPPTPKLFPLETISFSKSVRRYLFCKEVHWVLFSDSTCQW